MESNSTLKDQLNACKSGQYTRIADLREDTKYLVLSMERATTPFGETVVLALEGHLGEDTELRVYLPRRFNDVLPEERTIAYNSGLGARLFLVRRKTIGKYSPLEFV